MTSTSPIQIKKYGNRRFYSSDDSRFVTLDEISACVRGGRKVRVTDSESGEDITSEILTQILLESGRAHHFPVELLEQMIRINEQALKSFWGGYLEQSMRAIESFQDTLRSFNPFFAALGGMRQEEPQEDEKAELSRRPATKKSGRSAKKRDRK